MRREPHNTIERTIEVNGIPVQAMIRIYIDEDHDSDPFDMDFESPEDRSAYERRFTRGELFNAWIQVVATAHGIDGSDTLCNVHMHCNNMFNPAPFEADLKSTLEDHDMIQNALNELTRELIEQANTLQPFATKAGAQ